jgi:hypothetical protein
MVGTLVRARVLALRMLAIGRVRRMSVTARGVLRTLVNGQGVRRMPLSVRAVAVAVVVAVAAAAVAVAAVAEVVVVAAGVVVAVAATADRRHQLLSA